MTTTASVALSFSQTAFVACNIYISSASSADSALQNLLRRAQDHCRCIRQEDNLQLKDFCRYKSAVAVIHAFADVPYNRSSFHLAGRSDCVADVAINLILDAFDKIEFNFTTKTGSAHPFVGLVDHVSVMPLVSFPMNNSSSQSAVAAANAIGNGITAPGRLVNVHYYGLACPNNMSLAKVRKENTRFFNSGASGSSATTLSEDVDATAVKGDCTIGVPDHFVENFNIRLSSNVDFPQAKTLTQFVRGRNRTKMGYGIEGVEALTLPYQKRTAAGQKDTVYEVACNLTNPAKGSVHDIKGAVNKWIEQQSLSRHVTGDNIEEYFIDDMYRVGTTEKQCIHTLLMGCKEDSLLNTQYWKDHDADVLNRFQHYLMEK
jgi:glutamate formiminotransferase